MKASQQKLLQTLDKKLKALDIQMKQRKQEQQKVNAIFIQHVKKQLEMLDDQLPNVKQRNSIYLGQIKEYRQAFNKFAPQVMEIDEKIRQAQQRFLLEYIDHESALSQYQPEPRNRY